MCGSSQPIIVYLPEVYQSASVVECDGICIISCSHGTHHPTFHQLVWQSWNGRIYWFNLNTAGNTETKHVRKSFVENAIQYMYKSLDDYHNNNSLSLKVITLMKAFKKIAEHNSDNGCNECT